MSPALPFIVASMRLRQLRGKASKPLSLLQLRSFYVAWVTLLFAILLPLTRVLPLYSPRPEALWIILPAGMITWGYMARKFLKIRPPDGGDSDSERGAMAYASNMFLWIGLPGSGVLFGFVCSFNVDGWWLYLAALTVASPGLVEIAPSRRGVQRFQAQTQPRVDLWSALTTGEESALLAGRE